MNITENVEKIRENIKNAAEISGRKSDDITLVAVSKKKSLDNIKTAYECGVRDFGESYVQEFIGKMNELKDVKWHFIGQLQSNKVKYIFRDIYMLHSLDRKSLAKELNKYLKKENIRLKSLVQVNIGKEAQKGGILPEDTEKYLAEFSQYECLDICGLMSMPPYSNTKEDNIRDFAATKKIYDDMISAGFNLRYLSMGMSGDYEDAIKQGANVVRVGSAIFGDRL